jgi:hypothetical protein
MKRILRGSALAGCIVAAVWMVSLAPIPHNFAYAQRTLMRGQTVVYYNEYGQGYYGVNGQNYGATYVLVPNNGYSGFGNGPYGNGYGRGPYYLGYNNSGYYDQSYGQAFRHPPYGYPPSPPYNVQVIWP